MRERATRAEARPSRGHPVETTQHGSNAPVELVPLRARRTLWVGTLAFRWLAFGWMVLSNVLLSDSLVRPVAAWTALGLTAVWNLWFTLRADRRLTAALWVDLAVSFTLVAMSGLMVPPGDALVESDRTFFATIYPAGTLIAWGAVHGWKGGVFSALVLGVALGLSRMLNGYPLTELSPRELVGLGNGIVYFLVAGAAPGVMSTALDRAAEQLQSAIDDAIRARERAARLGEREALARSIHDSVLNALGLLKKRGRDLARDGTVPASEVLGLVEMADDQEKALRALIFQQPFEPPEGAASLQETLREVVSAVRGLPVEISARPDPIWLPAADAEELAAAVRQALENVVQHAQARRAVIFAELEDAWVTVFVRDDGVGFVYDEGDLEAAGKAGLLRSMKGRVEGLGGRMRVMSAPGLGTEVEFRLPLIPSAPARPERFRDRWHDRVAERLRRGPRGGGPNG